MVCMSHRHGLTQVARSVAHGASPASTSAAATPSPREADRGARAVRYDTASGPHAAWSRGIVAAANSLAGVINLQGADRPRSAEAAACGGYDDPDGRGRSMLTNFRAN